MDFTEAIIFVAAILVIIGAGIMLGMAIRGRNRDATAPHADILAGKAALYAEIAQSLDNLPEGGIELKRYFMQRYYQSLIYASDEVVDRLNIFLDTEAGTDARDHARDELLITMRRDVQSHLGNKTRLGPRAFYKIEVAQQSTSKLKK